MKIKYWIIIILLCFLTAGFYYNFNKKQNLNNIKTNEKEAVEKKEPEVAEPIIEEKDILITAVGDCTIGTDSNFGYEGSFTQIYDKANDPTYFFKGVYEILSNDDLSIANLETTFTTSNNKAVKKFNFKGPKEYANILPAGSIEAVNLANNHTYDFNEEGYNDTIAALKDINMPYFGYDNYYIMEIKGIRIGLAGITSLMVDTAEQSIENTKKAIDYFKDNNTDMIIITYHWGLERHYKQNEKQEKVGHFAIDYGADLVIGHHPHVLQGIEEYNGKYIVYSLANFVFGGNRNPQDKDTMLFQINFHFKDNKITDSKIKIIPASVSSKKNVNDYQPTILQGEEKKRVLNKILNSSTNLIYTEE